LGILVGAGAAVLSALPAEPLPQVNELRALSQPVVARDWSHFAEIVASREQGTRHLKPDNQSRLVFSEPNSPVAIVYLHGFSASPKEVSPVPELIAEKLRLPLYMPRLAGHGLAPEDLGNLTYLELIQSAFDAVESARQLSPEIIVIATSTGATLSETLLRLGVPLKASIYLSPNFGTYNPFTFLLTSPFGKELARLLVGTDYEWVPAVDLQHQYWSTKYPSSGLVAMAQAVKVAQQLRETSTKIPQLTFFGHNDQVIDVEKARAYLSENSIGQFERIEAPNHLLAGDIVLPKNNEAIVNRSLRFIETLALPSSLSQ
jgi:esterase/lipase